MNNHKVKNQSLRQVRLKPSEICRMLKIARDTFGTFEFTYVPESLKEGKDVTQGPDANFWETSVFCVCFFPKMAWKDSASDPSTAVDEKNFKARKRGFKKVCSILGCNAEDEVVGISPIL